MSEWKLYVDEDNDFAFGKGDRVLYTTSSEDTGDPESSLEFLRRWASNLEKWTEEEAEDAYHIKHIYTGSFDRCWSHYQRMCGYL